MLRDDEIVGRVLSGNAELFGALVKRHEGLVAAICRSLLGDDHEALDAAQDTFVRAYLNLGQLREPKRLKAWLRRVAYSVCMNRLKKRGRSSEATMTPEELDATDVPTGTPGPPWQAEARELAQAVLGSIAELPEKYREPIEMFYLEGASGAEIAGRLGLEAGAVRTRLSRGREMLRPALARHWPIETLSRTKQTRGWLPLKLEPRETGAMKLEYERTRSRLLRGEAQVTIRPMKREDIPAMRTYDRELTATLDDYNANLPPGGITNDAGGPWSDDQWLLEHFNKYQTHGGMTLLAEDQCGRIVGFADLWPTEEPEPFGKSLNAECVDYFREYFLAGLETILLTEAEKVARAANLPALDIGTNTCSGEYTSLRRFGLKVFYEYDHVLCRCGPTSRPRPERTVLTPETADLAGLIKVSHWCPTDFTFRPACQTFRGQYIVELIWPDRRAVLELWRFEGGRDDWPIPENPPNGSELYVQPEAFTSAEAMSETLAECAMLAGEAGAEEMPLPCPSEIALDASKVEATDRHFAFAWLRPVCDIF